MKKKGSSLNGIFYTNSENMKKESLLKRIFLYGPFILLTASCFSMFTPGLLSRRKRFQPQRTGYSWASISLRISFTEQPIRTDQQRAAMAFLLS